MDGFTLLIPDWEITNITKYLSRLQIQIQTNQNAIEDRN